MHLPNCKGKKTPSNSCLAIINWACILQLHAYTYTQHGVRFLLFFFNFVSWLLTRFKFFTLTLKRTRATALCLHFFFCLPNTMTTTTVLDPVKWINGILATNYRMEVKVKMIDRLKHRQYLGRASAHSRICTASQVKSTSGCCVYCIQITAYFKSSNESATNDHNHFFCFLFGFHFRSFTVRRPQ